MKQELYHFYCNKVNNEGELLVSFSIVKSLDNGLLSIRYEVLGVRLKHFHYEISISEFEYLWKINISELLSNENLVNKH